MPLAKSIQKVIALSLKEDAVGRDITTNLTIHKDQKIKAEIRAKQKGILCGIGIAKAVFKQVSPRISFKAVINDGRHLKRGQLVAVVSGKARDILRAERVSLNFLSLLSGVATLTRQFVDKTKGTKAKIFDTRKTIANLRQLQKYAVRVGGGFNHRSSLSEAILIKDNHLRAGCYIKQGKLDQNRLARLIKKFKTTSSGKVEIEVETLTELKQALNCKPDIIMLDNFSLANLKKAVRLLNQCCSRVTLEASGGINLKNIKVVARTGVERISIGFITHSSKAIDFSLEINSAKPIY